MANRRTVIEIELPFELDVPQAMETSSIIREALMTYIEQRTPALSFVHASDEYRTGGASWPPEAVAEKCNTVRWRCELAQVLTRGAYLARVIDDAPFAEKKAK